MSASDNPIEANEALLTIKSERDLSLNGNRQWSEGTKYFIQIYEGFLSSGLLTELHGTEIKILLILGLRASPLGIAPNGTPEQAAQADRFFRDLISKGIAREEDKGRLFCYIEHDELCHLVDVSDKTLTKYANRLRKRGLVERRTIERGSYSYVIYFIEPTAYIDKYNVLHPRHDSSSPPTIASVGNSTTETSVVSQNQLTTNLIDPDHTAATTTAAAANADFDDQAVIAHFAARKGVARYRLTAHDRIALQRLQEAGVSQSQVIAAIDQAFDARDPDAPPIRMFSYCATALLQEMGTPLRQVSVAKAPSAVPPQPPSPGETVSATVEAVTALYQAEIGPVTPAIQAKLQALLQHHPLLRDWEYAFGEAAANNIRKLSYVKAILDNPGHRRPHHPATTRRKERETKRALPTTRRSSHAQDHRVQPGHSTRNLEALREQACQVAPLSIEEVLGTADA